MTDAERGKIDPMFLACEVLGMDFQPNPHAGLFSCFLQCDPQKNLSELDPEVKKRMILWPRGLFKTSAVRVIIVQLILNYPEARILMGYGSFALGKVQLAAVKRIFENPTPKFKELYPEFCGKKLGNASTFTVPNRSDFSSPEATVTMSTAKSVKAGSHYDFVFIDDLVNDQNYRNPVALEQCWNDYKDFGPLRDPGGYLFVTGTPYSFGDTYERIEDAAKNEMRVTGKTVWKISARTCWVERCRTCNEPDIRHGDGMSNCTFVPSGKKDVLFPEVKLARKTIGHTIEFLESEKREKGDEFFACQYECTRLSRGMQTFTDELIDAHTLYHFEKPMQESELERMAAEIRILTAQGKTFDESLALIAKKPGKGEIPLGGWTFIMGDLSYVGDERNGAKRDKSVFLVIRVVNGRLYVIACHFGKWKSGDVGEQVVFLLLKYRPKVIWCEGFLGWEAYDTVIRMMAAVRGIQQLPLEWLPLDNQPEAKVVRIGSTHAWFTRDKLYLFAGIEGFQEIKDNLKKWPKLGRHDDFGDCLGLAVNAPHGVALMQSQKENASTLDNIRKYLYPQGLPFSTEFNEKENAYAGNQCGSSITSG